MITKVKEMTDAELNRKLAGELGFSMYHYDKDVEANCYFMLMDPTGDYSMIGRPTEEMAWLDAPWFTGDPAASLEVQATACEVNESGYICNLQVTMGWTAMRLLLEKYVARVCNATPRQRAEAAYMTLLQQRDSQEEYKSKENELLY